MTNLEILRPALPADGPGGLPPYPRHAGAPATPRHGAGSHVGTALALALAVAGALPPSAYAQGTEPGRASEPVSDPIPAEAPEASAEGQILAIDRGERAPWAGLLIEEADLVRWKLEIDRLRWRLDVDVKAEQAKADVQEKFYEKMALADAERMQLKEAVYRDRIKDLGVSHQRLVNALAKERETTFFEQPMLWFGLGVVVTIATVVTGVAL